MGNIYGKFANENDIVLTAQTLTANNNQTALQATIAETDQLRGTAAIFQPTGLLATLTNDVPNVTGAAQGDLGAALGGVGQSGTPALEPGGGGNPCFIEHTRIATPTGDVHIENIVLGDIIWGFEQSGELVPRKVIGLHRHLVQQFEFLIFDEGSTGVTENHRYWTNPDYAPIKTLDSVWHWSDGWMKRNIKERYLTQKETVVYNLTVEGTHNYIANGCGVSNVKPIGGNES